MVNAMVSESDRTEHGYGDFRFSGRLNDEMVEDWRKLKGSNKSD
jgi:hypothetical protein